MSCSFGKESRCPQSLSFLRPDYLRQNVSCDLKPSLQSEKYGRSLLVKQLKELVCDFC